MSELDLNQVTVNRHELSALRTERDNLAQQRDEFWKDLTAARQENVRLTEECERLKRDNDNLLGVLESANAAAKRRGSERDSLLKQVPAYGPLLELTGKIRDAAIPFATALKSSTESKMIVEVGRPPEPHELVTQKQWEALSELVEQASVILAGTNTSLKQVPAYGPLLELVREMHRALKPFADSERAWMLSGKIREVRMDWLTAAREIEEQASALFGEINS